MSNNNPNDPNNLSLGGSSTSSDKPDFSNVRTSSGTTQGGGGSGGGADFSNVQTSSGTTQGAGGGSVAPGTSYTVQKGDSLSAIAKQHLGSANKWREIYEANRDVIGDNPDKIFPGQELRIPASGE